MRAQRRSIVRGALADPVVVVALVVAILSSVVVVVVGVKTTTSDRTREVVELADLAADRLRSILVRRDEQAARDVLDHFLGTSDVVSAALFDDDGRVVAVVGKTSADDLTGFEAGSPAEIFRADSRLVVRRPVTLDFQPSGTVVMESDESATDWRIQRVYLIGLSLCTISMILIVAIASGFARANARSTVDLVDVIARTLRDTGGAPVEAARSVSPWVQLSTAVRGLVERFEQQSRRLDEADEVLELELPERVADLEESLRECRQNADRLRQMLLHRETLVRETHHRVKNNFQIISALLNLEARHVADGATRDVLIDSRDRVHALALVHEIFCDSEDPGRIDIGRYLRRISSYLVAALIVDPTRVHVTVDSVPVQLDVARAVSVGLIVNELVSNALEHAFPGEREGTVTVTLGADSERAVLQVGDNGVGLTTDPDWGPSGSTLGFTLIGSLVQQLGGTVQVRRQDGTAFTVKFPLQSERGET